MIEFIKQLLGVPENWDKYDYQTQRYSLEDIEEVLLAYEEKQCTINGVVVPEGTLCDYCKKPMENTCCNDCLEEMDSHNH